jgi:hypothetical protein
MPRPVRGTQCARKGATANAVQRVDCWRLAERQALAAAGMRVWRAFVFLPAALVAVFVLVEGGIRAIYASARHRTALFPMLYERVYWQDVPPWVRSMSIFTADPEVGLWMKPHLDRTFINLFGPIGNLADVEPMFTRLIPTIPVWAKNRPVWRLTTNSLGIRNEEVSPTKPASTFRVIMLGDSWTVGANLDVEQTYVRTLQRLLGDGVPDGHVEVVNYGGMGATAETGRGLIERVLALHPDLVVVAYAQNDEYAVRDGTGSFSIGVPVAPLSTRLRSLWARALGSVESYQLLEYLRTRKPGAIEQGIKEKLMKGTRAADNERRGACLNPHATETPYRHAIDSVVTAALDRHVDVVLLYNNLPEFPSHCTLGVLSDVARRNDLPLVDASALLAAKRAALEAEIEQRRDLVPPPRRIDRRSATTVVLRVDMAGQPGRPRVMGDLASLGNFQPNVVELFDDGTHGDQRANDGVWSLAIEVPGYWSIIYLYTNGDIPGAWTGLENYQPRRFTVSSENGGGTLYVPIAEFSRSRP